MSKIARTADMAIKTIDDFKKRGLIDNEWSFKWNRRKNHLGLCDFGNKTIQLSVYYVEHHDVEDDVKDTLLHELAHAIAGPYANHGPEWKKVCIQIGAKPLRCGKKVPNMPSKFKGICPSCGEIYHAQRQLSDMNRRLCQAKGCTAKKTKSYVKWKEQNV